MPRRPRLLKKAKEISCDRPDPKRDFYHVLILIIIYLLLANAKSLKFNPFIPGRIMETYMVLPVIAGILFGCRVGLFSGIFGTIAASLIPKLNTTGLYDMIPHGIIGLIAGLYKNKIPSPILAFLIIIGQVLKTGIDIVLGNLSLSVALTQNFILGIMYESFIGIITIIVISSIYRLGFEERRK